MAVLAPAKPKHEHTPTADAREEARRERELARRALQVSLDTRQ